MVQVSLADPYWGPGLTKETTQRSAGQQGGCPGVSGSPRVGWQDHVGVHVSLVGQCRGLGINGEVWGLLVGQLLRLGVNGEPAKAVMVASGTSSPKPLRAASTPLMLSLS